MPKAAQLEKLIFGISGPQDFNGVALKIFYYQQENNPVYRKFIQHLYGGPVAPAHYTEIPAVPIGFFKTHNIRSGTFDPEVTFTSSGTTGMTASRHDVRSARLYESSFLRSFEMFFGDVRGTVILALLPAYLERSGSSLVYMADSLIAKSEQPASGFYLDDLAKLGDVLKSLRSRSRRVILLGVTFALLDLAEQYPVDFPDLIVMETGGMKGRRREMTREEVHDRLKKAFRVDRVCSEYGMTELLSQAYSLGEGIFTCPPWMKVTLRDINDPLTPMTAGKTGGVNVIDLANLYSCSFIATQDLGRIQPDGSFEVLGRFDHSDLRGCNLMVV